MFFRPSVVFAKDRSFRLFFLHARHADPMQPSLGPPRLAKHNNAELAMLGSAKPLFSWVVQRKFSTLLKKSSSTNPCPLSGVKRTLVARSRMSAFGPKQTYGLTSRGKSARFTKRKIELSFSLKLDTDHKVCSCAFMKKFQPSLALHPPTDTGILSALLVVSCSSISFL